MFFNKCEKIYLTLYAPCISGSCMKIQSKLNFIFTFCSASRGFMKAFKAVIKPSEAPQGSAKI